MELRPRRPLWGGMLIVTDEKADIFLGRHFIKDATGEKVLFTQWKILEPLSTGHSSSSVWCKTWAIKFSQKPSTQLRGTLTCLRVGGVYLPLWVKYVPDLFI